MTSGGTPNARCLSYRCVTLLSATFMMLANLGGAFASAPDLFGYGARGMSLMGAGASTSRGHEAVYYNAAALGLDHDLTFSVGFQYGAFGLDIDGSEVDTRTAPALVIGFGVPIPLQDVMKDRLTLGLAFILPQNSVLIADLPRPGQPDFTVVGNRAQTVSIMGGLGIRILDQLSVGLSFLALAELDGGISVKPNAAGTLGSEVKSELVAGWSMHVGIVGKPVDNDCFTLTVGATWRDVSEAKFSYPLTVDLGDQFALPIPKLNVAGTAQYDPMQVGLDVSLEGKGPIRWLVGLGAVYKFWSAFENPIIYTAVPENYPAQPPPEFVDTVAVRLGSEVGGDVDEVRLTGRLGTMFELTPAPEQTGFHNYLDNNRVGVGFGLEVGWRWFRVAVSGQVQFLLARTSVKDPAAVLPDAPGFPEISHGGEFGAFAIELGVKL